MFFLFILGIIWMSRPVETALDPAARERVRHEWDGEIRGHEQIRRAWNKEVAAHETIRVGWDNERQELIAMHEQLVRDREQWMRDREEEKREERRRKKEEDARSRARFYWADLKSEQRCLHYGTREYTARLFNNNQVQVCSETAIEIHGVKIASPNQCEDKVT
jgi:hypothetical protein